MKDKKETVEVLFGSEEDSFSVIKNGEELTCFDREANIGDIFYNLIGLLDSLGHEVKHD